MRCWKGYVWKYEFHVITWIFWSACWVFLFTLVQTVCVQVGTAWLWVWQCFSLCFEVSTAFSKGMMFYFSNQALFFHYLMGTDTKGKLHVYLWNIVLYNCIRSLPLYSLSYVVFLCVCVCFSLLSLLVFWDMFTQSLYTKYSHVNH